jgi:hypothetical protein
MNFITGPAFFPMPALAAPIGASPYYSTVSLPPDLPPWPRIEFESKLTKVQTKKPYPADRAFGSAALNLLSSNRNDGHRAALFGTFHGELDGAVLECEQGVILAATNVFARVEFGTALANNDVASQNELTAPTFDAQSLGM